MTVRPYTKADEEAVKAELAAPPAEDLALLALEREEAWEAYELCKRELAQSQEELKAVRRIRLREAPMVAAFERISWLAWVWETSVRDANEVLTDITLAVQRARKKSAEIEQVQKG